MFGALEEQDSIYPFGLVGLKQFLPIWEGVPLYHSDGSRAVIMRSLFNQNESTPDSPSLNTNWTRHDIQPPSISHPRNSIHLNFLHLDGLGERRVYGREGF